MTLRTALSHLSMAALVAVLASAAWGQTCQECHADKAEAFGASIHGGLDCTACHTSISGFPHPDKVTPVDCSACHADAAKTLASSVHATAGKTPCLGCHGDAHSLAAVSDPKSPMFALNIPATCGSCHKDQGALYRKSVHNFGISKDGLMVSATCASCHGSHGILKSSDPNSKTSRASLPGTCGNCHRGISQKYDAGIHGQKFLAGDPKAPVCSSCHNVHDIASVQSEAWQQAAVKKCGQCHAAQDETYHDTFHSQVSALGYTAVARCWNCHNEHDILPASNPNSTVAKASLIKTCGQCHKDANASFVKYDPHADQHNRKESPGLYFSAMGMNFLLAGTLGFFSLHTLLWFFRSLAEVRQKKGKL